MIKDRRLLEAIDVICSVDAELEVASELILRHRMKYKDREKRFGIMRNSLRAIHKWNGEVYKDEAIAALSEGYADEG